MILPPGNTPDDLLADFERISKDPDLAVQAFFRIRNTQGQLVQFIYNRAQRLLAQRSKGHKFVTVLKARKVGVSSRRFALDMFKCATMKNQHRVLLTHNEEAAKKLLEEKIMPLHDNCLIPLGGKKVGDMIFFKATNSRYYVGTAGSKTFGRGDDINGKHFSEVAWWESPDVIAGIDEAMEGILDADGLTETTANGYNFYRLDWLKAKQGLSRDHAIFLPWMVHEAYEADATGMVTGGQEQEIAQALGLKPRQIAWRRKKLAEMRDPTLFPQEYPETDSQAFLSSGRPVFDWVGLERARARCEAPKFVGYLRRVGNRIDLVEDKLGQLKVWQLPRPRHVYGIGEDVAEGIEGGAYSTGEVLDIGEGCQVAEWHGHLSPDLFGEEMALLSAWYNQAVGVPEEWPGPGGVTKAKLVELESHVWQNPEKKSERGGHQGWETNQRTKPLIIGALNAGIRDRDLILKSADLLDECHAYKYTPSGSMEPSVGQFSDRLMGMAIIWYVSRQMATEINLDRAPRIGEVNRSARGGTSVPKFSGPRLGVRMLSLLALLMAARAGAATIYTNATIPLMHCTDIAGNVVSCNVVVTSGAIATTSTSTYITGSSGALAVTSTSTVITGTVPLPTGAATAAKQNPLDKYRIADEDSIGLAKYYGFTSSTAANSWVILKQNTTTSPYTYRYANLSNNVTRTDYGAADATGAWANRAALTYDILYVLTGL